MSGSMRTAEHIAAAFRQVEEGEHRAADSGAAYNPWVAIMHRRPAHRKRRDRRRGGR